MTAHYETSADIRCRCGERFQDTANFEYHMGPPATPPSDVTWLEHSGALTVANNVSVLRVHSAANCLVKDRCSIHKRSDHVMRKFPQVWRADIGIMERICEHEVGHPDPDSPWDKDDARWSHGCCEQGCCGVAVDPVLTETAEQSGHQVTSVSWSNAGRAYVSCSCGVLMSGTDPHIIWQMHEGPDDS